MIIGSMILRNAALVRAERGNFVSPPLFGQSTAILCMVATASHVMMKDSRDHVNIGWVKLSHKNSAIFIF